MKKKLLNGMVLAILLVLILFAGCSPQKQPSSTAADIVTSASIVNNGDALAKALSKDGYWLAGVVQDVTSDKELVIEGDFHDKNDPAQPLYRKLALYSQDENYKVTDRYLLTAPKLIVKSPNTKIQGGTFIGDVYVEANGFTIQDATVEGNVYFATQEYMDSFVLPTEEGKVGKVTGSTEVKSQ